MDTLTNEELTKAVQSIELRLEQLAAPYENALSHRIFTSVQKSFRVWLATWIGVFSLVTGIVGYFGYEEIISGAKKAIQDQISDQIRGKLQEDIEKELSKARDQVKATILESSLNDVARLDTELAQLFADTQSAIDLRIKEFANKLSPVLKDPHFSKTLTEKPKPEQLSGFAYYGIYSNGTWTERNFRVAGRANDSYPKIGDIVVAKVPVNARSGVISFTTRGWVNKPAVGLIKTGRKIEVKSVETVAGGSYVWIEFVTKD
jgi:hypothetical protein